ncbi:Cellulosome-anchoring protein precursor [compost metagenome]
MSGYKDGTYRPNDTITRGELMALINRSFGLKESSEISFADLSKSNWAYEQAAIAVHAGYVQGYEDGTIRTGNTVSREEASSMIAKLLGVQLDVENALEQFSDTTAIAAWSKPAVSALLAKGIIKGYPDRTYRPQGSITRAESVIALTRALQANSANQTFNKSGTYGPETGTQVIKGNASINVAGVTLKNMIIEGNLTLAAGIAEGDVFLDNVKVGGTTTVSGGGEHSVHVKDSVLVNIIVNKKEGMVRIVAEGATSVQSVTVQSSVKLEEDSATGAGFTDVKLAEELPQGAAVQLLGQFDTVDIAAQSIRVEIRNGSIAQLNVNKQAGQVALDLNQQAKILNLILDAAIKLTGQGTVENAVVNEGGKGSAFEKQPVKSGGSGIQPPVTLGGSGGSSDSGGTSPQPAVNQYGLVIPSELQLSGSAAIFHTNDEQQLVDNNGNTISDMYYLQDKPYIFPELAVTQNNGQPYSGYVRITATAVAATQGAFADDIQVFSYHSGSSAYWVNILKTGFGDIQGSSIDSVMHQLSTANKWYVVAKPGTYSFRLQAVDVATGKIIAQSAAITITSNNVQLSILKIGNYELTQLDAHGINKIGTGFNPDVVNYQTYIPNNVENAVINVTSPSGTSIEVKQLYPATSPGEPIESLITPIDGAYNLSISAGLMPSVNIVVKTDTVAKSYSLVIFRFKDPVSDPTQFDSTDIRLIDANTFMITGIQPSVTVSVYDAEFGGKVLESKQTPASSSLTSSLLVSVGNLSAQSKTGTVWFSIDDSLPRVAKEYNATPVSVLPTPTGWTIRALTADEIAQAQSHGYSYATTGFKLSLDHNLLPTELQDFAYFTYSWSSQSNTSTKVYDEVKPSERSALVPKGSGGVTINNFYESESGNYYRIVFFDKNDRALGFIEILDTATP